MAEVITKLKVDNQGFDQKIKNAQRSLDQFGLKGSEAGRKLSGLTNMFTSGVSKIGPWGAALGAAAGALKVAGDAFKQNELVMDEWGRICESTKGIYDGFISSLNNGDISGYLTRINDIVAAAREAYDAMDELQTFNAFNKRNLQQSRTGLDEAITKYKSGEGTAESVRDAGEKLKEELKTRQEKEKNAYEEQIKLLAQTRGVDYEELQKIFNGSYGDFEKIKNAGITGTETIYKYDPIYGTQTGSYQVNVPANDIERLGVMLRKLNDDEIDNIQTLGATADATGTEIAGIDERVRRALSKENKKTSTSTAKSVDSKATSSSNLGRLGELQDYASTIEASMKYATNEEDYAEMNAELMRVKNLITEMTEGADAFKVEIGACVAEGSLDDLNEKLQKALENLRDCVVGSEDWDNALKNVVASQKAVNDAQGLISKATYGTENIDKKAEKSAASWRDAAQAVGQLGGALAQTGSKELNVAGIIAQAVAQVALGLGEALSTKNHETVGPWDWIAAAISGTATMIGTIASIKSATSGYAEGGLILPNGSPYQGDNIVARLNAGEGVLTAQGIENAGRLASQSRVATGNLSATVRGRDIILAMNNEIAATGGSRGQRIYSH